MKRQTKPRSWTDENFLRLVAAWQAGGIAACCEAFPQLNKNTLKTIIHNYVRGREIGETDAAPIRPSTRSTYTAHDAWANKMLGKKWIIAALLLASGAVHASQCIVVTGVDLVEQPSPSIPSNCTIAYLPAGDTKARVAICVQYNVFKCSDLGADVHFLDGTDGRLIGFGVHRGR